MEDVEGEPTEGEQDDHHHQHLDRTSSGGQTSILNMQNVKFAFEIENVNIMLHYIDFRGGDAPIVDSKFAEYCFHVMNFQNFGPFITSGRGQFFDKIFVFICF